MPSDVSVTETEVQVHIHRRAHLPIVLASGLLNAPVLVAWWPGFSLRLSAQELQPARSGPLLVRNMARGNPGSQP
jgi:hypothetical protein